MNPRIYDNQLYNLIGTFSDDDHLKDFYDWENTDGLKKMSTAQYWFAMRLWKLGAYIRLKVFLDDYLQHKI